MPRNRQSPGYHSDRTKGPNHHAALQEEWQGIDHPCHTEQALQPPTPQEYGQTLAVQPAVHSGAAVHPEAVRPEVLPKERVPGTEATTGTPNIDSCDP